MKLINLPKLVNFIQWNNKEGIQDNSAYFSIETYVVGTH